MKAIHLMTAHMKNPLGIDIRQPVLTWNVVGGIRQSAYQVIAFCEGAEVWSTGKMESSLMQVKYGGPAVSRNRICWNVRVWDEKGEMQEPEGQAYFEYAFLKKSDFQAKWINPEISEIN